MSSPVLVCSFSSLQRYNTVTSHRTQPSVGPPMSGYSSSSADHNRRNFTQGQYSTQPVSTSISQVLAIPPPQIDYSTTTNMLPNYDSWNNVSTLHSTQYHNPVLGGASIGHSSSPAIGSGYFSPPTSQKYVLRYHV